jgi:hypothetical protein
MWSEDVMVINMYVIMNTSITTVDDETIPRRCMRVRA